MIYIKGIKIDLDRAVEDSDQEPEEDYFHEIEAIRNTKHISINHPITFFVGENGSGKSTLLEAIAVAFGFNAEGGSIHFNFSSKNTTSDLYAAVTLEKEFKRPKDGFFLRAESFYNVASELENLAPNKYDSFWMGYGGKSLHSYSHGESFMALIENRFRGQGLYLLDEPEAALSPQRQLSLLVKIKELLQKGSQFIIATHSPILLGFPDAAILSFDDKKICAIDYEDTESYKITKMFLDNREYFLNQLFRED